MATFLPIAAYSSSSLPSPTATPDPPLPSATITLLPLLLLTTVCVVVLCTTCCWICYTKTSKTSRLRSENLDAHQAAGDLKFRVNSEVTTVRRIPRLHRAKTRIMAPVRESASYHFPRSLRSDSSSDKRAVLVPTSEVSGTATEHPTRSTHHQPPQDPAPLQYPLPQCMTLCQTLVGCTSRGLKYDDDADNFTLHIPSGAIPVGNTPRIIDIGVALHGPFQFPSGLRPVSPIFWVCVRDQPDFQFSQPVRITIPHFLNLSSIHDIQSLGLTFLKADHQMNPQHMYQFKPTDGEIKFEPLMKYGVLKTTHFCSLCIACRDTPECLEKTTFCITALPNAAIPVGRKTYGYFFVTFKNLKTCLRRLKELIKKKNLNESYENQSVEFRFDGRDEDPALEMALTQPTHGTIGVRGIGKVNSNCSYIISMLPHCCNLC